MEGKQKRSRNRVSKIPRERGPIFGMNEKLGGRSATVPHHTHLLQTVGL